jgi:hypothetical protein
VRILGEPAIAEASPALRTGGARSHPGGVQ